MIKNILSSILLLISVVLSFRHGWSALNFKSDSPTAGMMADLHIDKTFVPYLGVFTLLIGVLLLFPKTFFLGNLLNAISILTIMALALHTGHIRIALIEIPFLIMPLVLIWLQYPFKNK
jgi:hypothetical protein